MAARRQLIVVSNRGPVSYTRDEGGARDTLRGGGGLVDGARAASSTQHDVTWIASAMTDEDRVVAASRRRSRRRPATARCTACARTIPSPTTATTTSSPNPTLWFLQHLLWGSVRARPRSVHHAWSTATRPVNANLRGGRPGSSTRARTRRPLHDYHLYLAPALVRERPAGCASAPTSCTSRGRRPILVTCCR